MKDLVSCKLKAALIPSALVNYQSFLCLSIWGVSTLVNVFLLLLLSLSLFFFLFSVKKTAPWLSVPQFGDWDQKGELPDYSMDFSKIREMRKQNKRDVSRASLGNEEDFINPTATNAKAARSEDRHNDHYHQSHHHSPNVRFFVHLYLESFIEDYTYNSTGRNYANELERIMS